MTNTLKRTPGGELSRHDHKNRRRQNFRINVQSYGPGILFFCVLAPNELTSIILSDVVMKQKEITFIE
jgi:hypothetical protein